MMRGTSRGSLRTSTMSPASTATSVPAPIAIPTSAATSAGASFTPSPTIATRSPALHEVDRALAARGGAVGRGAQGGVRLDPERRQQVWAARGELPPLDGA